MGALIGAVIAGGIALYGMYQNSQAADEAKADAQKAAAALKESYEKLVSDVEAHYSKDGKDPSTYANEDDYTSYLEKLRASNTEDFVKQYYADNGLGDKFSYEHDTNGDGVTDAYDFMDKRAEILKEAEARKALDTAAGAGMGRSYHAAQAMTTARLNKDEELYKNALAEYNTDRTQNYNEWNAYLQQKQNELTNLLTGQQNDLNNSKQLADMYKADQDAEWQDLMNARIAALQGGFAADSMVANTGNYQYDVGGAAQMIGAGANVGDKVGGYFSSGTSSPMD